VSSNNQRIKNIGDIYVNPKGVKWKWNGKGWASLKESDITYITGPTGPSGGPSILTYQFAHSSMDPVDNMSYYIGNIPDSPAQSSSSVASKRVKSLVDGHVKNITIMTQILGDLGSQENQTFIIKNFTKNISVTIVSDYKNTLNSQLDTYNLTTPLEITKDDELEIIWQVPTFELSPGLVRHSFNAFIEC
jgi:hypothetical protein